MTTSGGLILETNLESYFHERVRDARKSLAFLIADEVEFYLVQLLCEFSRGEGKAQPMEEPLALIYHRALDADPLTRLSLLKELGDLALYVAGYFSDALHNQSVDEDYYVSMGGTAYSCVADLIASQRKGDGIADIYAEMSSKFESLVRLLNEVSAENYSSGKDLVNLYGRWLRTGSPKAHKVLLEQGLITSSLSPEGED